ncbi:ankyrin repeat domain-containing protein 34B isoform X1 [Microcaecilia unicolor]|uniref:Ankyrin repeat domain-containing protein 34B isoform X1 n=1 Tax=Microcaecilia unicolor TaxID=1415580 RepID=A0A6P7WY40_9AMPH|nr:ankyrin repeat domain-containing protein 34B isoform X1 [Microcaecilia unicolor]
MDEAVEVTTEGNSLIKAVYQSRLRLTRLLLEGGAYINESNDRGETPLMIACKTKHVDQQSVSKVKMIKYLLENNADPNIQDKYGKTALMHACLEKSGPEVISLLLNSGADPSLQDHSGCSALVYAVNSEDKGTLKVLLNACKARGKEVIIITKDKSSSGKQTTKQYLNVPPSPDMEGCHSPCSCTSPSEIELKSSPSSLSDTLSSEKELFNFKDPDPVDCYKGSSQPGSPTRKTQLAHFAAKLPHLQRLHSEPWLKIPSALLHQHKQQSSLPEELQDITPEEELSIKMNALALSKRYFTRHQSIDVKDTSHLLKTFDQAGPRKLSCDEIHTHSLYSEGNHNSSEIPVDQDPDSMHSISVSSLRSIVQRRNLGANHYSSDSQLTRCIGPTVSEDSKSLLEKKKMFSQAAVLSSSRDSLESIPSSLSRRNPSGLERRGSGALLLDHIAQTRPGFLPPLNINPHPPIPDINPHKMSSIITSVTKPFVPTAPSFPKEFKNKKVLLRRHSMHTEQIKQLVNRISFFSLLHSSV